MLSADWGSRQRGWPGVFDPIGSAPFVLLSAPPSVAMSSLSATTPFCFYHLSTGLRSGLANFFLAPILRSSCGPASSLVAQAFELYLFWSPLPALHRLLSAVLLHSRSAIARSLTGASGGSHADIGCDVCSWVSFMLMSYLDQVAPFWICVLLCALGGKWVPIWLTILFPRCFWHSALLIPHLM